MAQIFTFKKPTVQMRAALLDGEDAQTNGTWVLTEGYQKFGLHIIITNTATAQLFVSNEASPAADGGVQYGNDHGQDAYVAIDTPVRWMRVGVSAYTSGTVDAHLEACS